MKNLDLWLEQKNKEFQSHGVESSYRPMEAIKKYSIEFNVSVDLTSEIAKEIFQWFIENSKSGLYEMPPYYNGVYFYDTQFWEMTVPLCYGQISINAMDCLDMPNSIKKHFDTSTRLAWDYLFYWACCVDYSYGLDEIKRVTLLEKDGMNLLLAADQELQSATSLITQNHINERSILNCRMAIEMFFKSYIVLKGNMSIKEVKKTIAHNLYLGLDKFIETSGINTWEEAREILKLFPEIHDRYKELSISSMELWKCYSLAQNIGSFIVREFTQRNMLEEILKENCIDYKKIPRK